MAGFGDFFYKVFGMFFSDIAPLPSFLVPFPIAPFPIVPALVAHSYNFILLAFTASVGLAYL